MKRIVALFALLVTTVTAWAAAPRTPVEFELQTGINPGTNTPAVFLMWMQNKEGDLPTRFEIYHADGITEEMSAFTKTADVPYDPNARGGIYQYQVNGLATGQHTFFVKAANDDGSSDRTRIRTVTLKEAPQNEPAIMIVSRPLEKAAAGVTYRYPVRAEKNFEGAFHFAIKRGPDGMKIDEATGIITWENPVEGEYGVLISVSADTKDGKTHTALQEFKLIIGKKPDPKPELCGVINGYVRIEGSNDVVEHGVVSAFSVTIVRKERNGQVYEETVVQQVAAAELQHGSYMLNLPAGTYKLRVEGVGFEPEWHENARELADAANVAVVCDNGATKLEINFNVTALAPIKIVTAKGRVTDEATGEGLRAVVVFEAAKQDRDKPMQRNFARMMTETDEEGNYIIDLPDHLTFIAYAQALGKDRMRSPYLVEYWQETADATTATAIVPADGMEDVNFTLSKRETYANTVSGTLVDSAAGTGVRGWATAYLLDGTTRANGAYWASTVETSETGEYEFTDLIPGSYIIFGMPAERPLVPGWYVAGGLASHDWNKATRVNVEATSAVTGADIVVIAAKVNRGKGKLRGFVFDKRGGLIAKADGPVQGAMSVPGALLVVRDNEGAVIDFAMSDNAGTFELANLPVATVAISVNRIGFAPATENIDVDETSLEEGGMDRSFGVVSLVSSVEVPTDAVGNAVNLYPNPASAGSTIMFNGLEGTASIRVLSMTGIVLATQNVSIAGGATRIALDLASMPAGMVMVQVTNGGNTFALPLSIVR